MSQPRARRSEDGDLERLTRFAEADPFAPLAYLALFGHPIGGDRQRDAIEAAHRAGQVLVIEGAGRATVGAIATVPNPYLSSHFGVPISHLGTLLVDPAVDRTTRTEITAEALAAAAPTGSAELQVLRVEAGDLATLGAATVGGFCLLETTLTWVNDLERIHLNIPGRSWPDIEVIRLGLDELPAETQLAGLRGGGALIRGDHYHSDPRLDPDRADRLYERWLDRGLRGDGSDVAILGHHEGALDSIGLWRRWRELEPYGVSMLGNGFGFRASWAPPGATRNFSAVVCNLPLLDNRLLEWSTQATNSTMANMISREASIRLCRTSYVLHRWSDG